MASDPNSPTWRSVLGQVRSCLAVMVLGLTQGTAIGWSSPALAKLGKGLGPVTPTPDESSWIVSMFDLFAGVGVLLGAAVFSHAGRRITLLVGPTTASAWCLLTYFAATPGYLMAARAMSGMGQGMCMSYSYIYVGEVASASLRGPLVLTVSLLLPVGQLIAYIVGPNVSYWTQALFPLPLAIISGLLMLIVMEETPLYLSMRGRHDEALAVLARLRGRRADDPGEAVRREAAVLRAAVERQQRDASTWRDTLRPPGAKRAALIVFVESGALALVGVTTVLAYTQQIFEKAGTPVPADVSAAVLIAIKVCMVLTSMLLIERLGRRLQLSLGALVNSAAMLVLAAFFLARDSLHADVSAVQWLPLACLVVYISATGIGVNAVPQVLMSELLSQRAKAVVAPVAIIFVSLTSFGLNKAFLLVGGSYGFYVPFGLYALTNLLICIFTLLVVPETKGKSLAEVQELLRGGRRVALTDDCVAREAAEAGEAGEDVKAGPVDRPLELTYTFPAKETTTSTTTANAPSMEAAGPGQDGTGRSLPDAEAPPAIGWNVAGMGLDPEDNLVKN